jgi:AcrR family transcriptional regulator
MHSLTMKSTRTNLSDSDTRREAIVEAAMVAFAKAGFASTPVTAVAAGAGISQAYVFKLFPTKEELFVAAVERCYERIEETLERSAAAAEGRSPDEILDQMGEGYADLIADRTIIMIQVHAQGASDIPAIREVVRRGLARIVRFTKQRSGASDDAVQRFIAFGQLCHLITTTDIYEFDDDWARIVARNIRH